MPHHRHIISNLTISANDIIFAKNNAMIDVDKNTCPHNHVCPLIRLCPVDAITQDRDGYPVVDHSLCIECGTCVENCPKGAMRQL